MMAPPMANAYVRAMGAKMAPGTPVSVKSGRKATPMISVENVIGVPTSAAALRMRSRMDPCPCGPRWRKMFSIMMTVESTTMPKSTAPSEMRLALVPVPTSPQNAQSSASGMLSAVISAARQLPRKSSRVSATRTMPTVRFSSTVCMVTPTRSPRS